MQGKPISTLQIRQRMLDKMSDTSRIVDPAYRKRPCYKNICPEDKRLVDVAITQRGKKLLEKMDAYNLEIDALFGKLSAPEVKTLNTLLDKIRS